MALEYKPLKPDTKTGAIFCRFSPFIEEFK
jgi:hypothetical protein